MNEKISQLKFSCEQTKVEKSLAIKEISKKLASIQSELTDYVKPTETESPSRNEQTIGTHRQFDKQSSMLSTDQNKIHPNANKQFDNLILGDSIIKRISHRLFLRHQETLKISSSGRGTKDVHSFVNEKLQLNVHPKNVLFNPKQAGGGGGGGIRPQAGSSGCCAKTVSSRKFKLCYFYYILIRLNSKYKPVPWNIYCCHGNAIVEGRSVKFWLKSVENCNFLLKSFSNLNLGLLFVISISKLPPMPNFKQIE